MQSHMSDYIQKVKRILETVPLIDGHNDLPCAGASHLSNILNTSARNFLKLSQTTMHRKCHPHHAVSLLQTPTRPQLLKPSITQLLPLLQSKTSSFLNTPLSPSTEKLSTPSGTISDILRPAQSAFSSPATSFISISLFLRHPFSLLKLKVYLA
eukprot:g73808.t1